MKMFDIMQTIFNFFSILYIHRFMIAFFDNAEKRESKWLTSLYLVYPILTSIVYLACPISACKTELEILKLNLKG